MEDSSLSVTSPAVLIAAGPRFDLAAPNGDRHNNATLGELRAKGVPEATLLALVKDRFTAAVDARAEAIRSAIATTGAGQSMEYLESQRQAFAALAEAEAGAVPAAGDYSMLAATIGIDIDPTTSAPAVDVLGVARSVRASYRLWLDAGAAIKAARLGGKKAIDDAATVEAAAAAYDAIVWPPLG